MAHFPGFGGLLIVSRVRRTIQRYALIEPGAKLLVACSGGPDSAAMLRVLTRLAVPLKFSVEAASVDHGLRAGATADVEVAASQAERVGVPFHALRVQVAPGASLQSQARDARYGALIRLARERGAARIAVGHTLEDQAETVLARLLRGSGVAGLAGIAPSRQDGVVRPLIDCRRADVHRYATRHFPELADDPSNTDPRFLRARMRTGLLPALLEEDPALVVHLAQLAEDAREVSSVIQDAADALVASVGDLASHEWVARLRHAPVAVRRVALSGWIVSATGHRPGRAQLQAMDAAVREGGAVWLTGGWMLEATSRQGLRLVRRELGDGARKEL